ncbi:DUF2267 domain-containing protein [Actinophytocola sp.]|uniref:DUF2267 domain-containing protein n=1 Tax=Actinophytocola sp. TaxID=1872138 RepID=UPI00389A2EA7
MKEQEIAAAVSGTRGLDDAEHAAAATRATLAVLAERLAGAEPPARLPAGIAEALPSAGVGVSFGVEEFYRRVADKESRGCTPDGGREHARAVVAALRSGVDADEFDALVSQLPPDYREDLLSTAPTDEQH